MTAKQAQAAWDALRRERDDLLLAIDRCEETKTALHMNLRAMRDERDELAELVEEMRDARSPDTPLFLSTIPEGMVLIEASLLEQAVDLTDEASNEDFTRQPLSDELRGLHLMLAAAQGERNAD